MEEQGQELAKAKLLIACSLSLSIGWLDLGNIQVEPLFGIVMGSAAVMSLWKPRLWTLWTVILGLGVPVATWVATWSQGQGVDFFNHPIWLDFVPAGAGALAGRLAYGLVDKKRVARAAKI